MKKWYYSASRWHLDDVMVGSITFYDFGSFWSMAVNTIDKLQFLSFIYLVIAAVSQKILSNISQGSGAARLMCGGIFVDDVFIYLPSSIVLEEFWRLQLVAFGEVADRSSPGQHRSTGQLIQVGNDNLPKSGDVQGVKARWFIPFCGCACGWQVKLCDSMLMHALSERLGE